MIKQGVGGDVRWCGMSLAVTTLAPWRRAVRECVYAGECEVDTAGL